jgi:hypothetical protein
LLDHQDHQEPLQFMILTINPNSFLALPENVAHQDQLEKREILELQDLLALPDLKEFPEMMEHLEHKD